MPVLMNKGTDPNKANWLFYTDHDALDALGRAIVDDRFDAGSIDVDAEGLDRAKASAIVPVYLRVRTLVPEDFDLGQLKELLEKAAKEARQDDEQGEAAEGQEAPKMDAAPTAVKMPYEAIDAPEDLRILVGSTTAAAARDFLLPREVDGKPWSVDLPGLQMLAQLIGALRDHDALPPCAVWHVDEQGILRMAPVKQAKPMAGNVLRCKA